MFRIIQVNRSETVNSEFVLLQNQGNMRLPLRGVTVMSDCAIETRDLGLAHVFSEDALIPPGAFILLHTGTGEHTATRCRDGIIYRTFMNRDDRVWSLCPGSIHVLAPQHTFVERRQPLSTNLRAVEEMALAI